MSLEEDIFEDAVSSKKRRPSSIETDITRLSGRHFPVENLPSGKRKVGLRRCVLCHKEGIRKETSYRCKNCPWNPALCVIPCFERNLTLPHFSHRKSSAMLTDDLNQNCDSEPNYDINRFAELELISLRKELILEEAKEKKREHELRMELLALQRQLLLQEAEDKRREHELRMKILKQNEESYIIKVEDT